MKNHTHSRSWFPVGVALVLGVASAALAGCGGGGNQKSDTASGAGMNEESTALRATAILEPTRGNDVHGTVTFETVPEGVRVTADVQGLSPGDHGFHIHETGDCSAPDGTSAGGHFNPTGSPHGGPDQPAGKRHAGDLGNIHADADGHATYDRIDTVIRLDGDESIIGRGMIVHAGADDLSSQPTGSAGARVACGVIHREGPETASSGESTY